MARSSRHIHSDITILRLRTMIPPINLKIANRLKEVSQLLHAQGSDEFRVRAYRHAADTLVQLETRVDDILNSEGLKGLRQLPGIGESIARSIHSLILTGKLPMLERLRGASNPVHLLGSIPGIGKKMADRLHHELAIDSLEDLEMAAYDGRLSHVKGIGEKRFQVLWPV